MNKHERIKKRHKALSELGYESYQDYLRSDLWRGIRRDVLMERPQCEVCGTTARLVHHRSYGKLILLGKNNKILIALCAGCHEIAHFQDGQFLPITSEQTQRLRALALLNGRSLIYDCQVCSGIPAEPFSICGNCKAGGIKAFPVRLLDASVITRKVGQTLRENATSGVGSP